MLSNLENLICSVQELKCKLILVIHENRNNKVEILNQLENTSDVILINLGVELGNVLAKTANKERSFVVTKFMSDLASQSKTNKILLLKNIELLFQSSLGVNPFEILKKLANSTCLIAIWPGEIKNNKLYYADNSHPEYREYNLNGINVINL